MRVQSVEIQKFRNHGRTTLIAAEGINAITGDNGEGKTNIIEAISYLCLTKSFYATSDGVTLQKDQEEFRINGAFTADNGATHRVEVRYDKTTARKTVLLNNNAIETLSSIIGEFPVVVLSPEQNGITFGAPTERRKFLDMVIAQASRVYLRELLEYRKILRQRNKILLDAKLARRDCSEIIEPWDQSLIESGASLTQRRWLFVRDFLPGVITAYKKIAGSGEIPGMEYLPSVRSMAPESIDAIKRSFEDELRARKDEERRTGVTAVGPHRDEVEFQVDGMTLRKFASQGQHKTYLVALKLAEVGYLKESCRENPILLLDDVFSELDVHRAGRLVLEVQSAGQVFITSTDLRSFPRKFSWRGNNRNFNVTGGSVAERGGLEHVHEAAGNSNN